MGQLAQHSAAETTAAAPVADAFLNCLAQSDHQTYPFDHWLLTNALPEGACEAIAELPFDPPGDTVFNGKRETNNATRVYFTPENQDRFDVCRDLVKGFNDPAVRAAIEDATGTDLTDCRLRIEYCQDTDGFWLEPHTDIFVKKFTMLVYLLDDERMKNAGTDIYEGPPDFKHFGTAPYGKNRGVIFIPSKQSWHGVARKSFSGVRKSIIINFVTSAWRDAWELA